MFNSLTQTMLRTLTLLLVALMCVSIAHAARPGKPGVRIYDQGLKEDTRVFNVICENGTRAGVSQRFDLPPPALDLQGNPVNTDEGGRAVGAFNRSKSKDLQPVEICAHPYGEKDHCKARWDIDKAARYACQKSRRK